MNINNYHSSKLETLRYDTLLTSKEFMLDSHNNLHMTEHSAFKSYSNIIHVDQIDPKQTIKKSANQSLLALGFLSIFVSAIFTHTTLFMGQFWTVGFAIVFSVFGIVTLFAAFKNQTTVYQYKHIEDQTNLFSISEPSFKDQRITNFIKALNNRIESKFIENDYDFATNHEISSENSYRLDKQSQYTKHLDFLFNHGIVDEVLYENLLTKINLKIDESENLFKSIDSSDEENTGERKGKAANNVIYFPMNA